MNAWRDWRWRVVAAMTAGVLAACPATMAKAGGEVPTLLAGGTAVVNGTRIDCSVTASSIFCKTPGGLAVTLTTANVARVLRTSPATSLTARPMKLGTNGGFVLDGSGGHNIYCHVYVERSKRLACAWDAGTPSGARGFDMSEREIVLFRYDAGGIRHDLESFPQPSSR
jgi:hypothetical protein